MGTVKNSADAGAGEDLDVSETKSSRWKRDNSRDIKDGNGNRVIRHIVKREATEVADVETEKVIQVIAPNDVQFALTSEDKEEVVINSGSSSSSSLLLQEAVCIDTPAFVGVTISFLMILIIALITIVFLWMRIKNLDRKSLL